jgi:hypothetical protein
MIDLRHNNKGFTLTLSLIFIFMLISFISVYLVSMGNGTLQANRTANMKRAYYVAEAGLADAYERIVNSGVTTLASSTCTNLNAPTAATCSNAYIPNSTTDTGKYTVVTSNDSSYVVSLQFSGLPQTNYIITSQGTYGNVTRTLQLKIESSTIARYAYWSQTEVNPTLGNLWWISGQLTTGPVQTNGTFNIMGNPVFDGLVSEVGSAPNYYSGTGSDPTSLTKSDPAYVFPDGEKNNQPAITLPPATTLGDFQTAATSNGLILTGASTVTFNAAGTITVTGNAINSSCKTTMAYHNTTVSVPANFVVYVQSTKTISACKSSASDGNVTVQGTVNGQLSVAADQNVYISGNVQYNTNPQTNSSSTDMLGLVANNNITVEEASAPAQLAIQAVLMALQGSFNVDQYSKNPDPITGGLDGANMSQFGSLINAYSGCTGVFNSSGKLVDGWNQIQSYDTRLAKTSPPGFPPLVNSSNQGVYVKEYFKECISGTCG